MPLLICAVLVICGIIFFFKFITTILAIFIAVGVIIIGCGIVYRNLYNVKLGAAIAAISGVVLVAIKYLT